MTDQHQTPAASPYIPYDARYPCVQKKQLNLQDYVVNRERLDQPNSYYLNLGAFVQFAFEAFPIFYPMYRIPDSKDPEGEHLLELFLRACYGKRFMVGTMTFRAVDDIGIHRGMQDWAIRWMQLWRQLPDGSWIGKEEVLSLLDCLWNSPMDARGLLDAQLDQWLYGKIYDERDQ